MISVRPGHDVAQADDLNVMTAAHESGGNFRHITGGTPSVRRENSRHEKNANRTEDATRSGARMPSRPPQPERGNTGETMHAESYLAPRTNGRSKKWRVILSDSGFHRIRDYRFRGCCQATAGEILSA